VDVFSKAQRSAVMARVRGKNTTPEKAVRSLLHRLGFRFRLHRTDLPGTPDIVMPGRRTALFVHGCFWHQHANCRSAKRPAGNRVYWNRKLDRNMLRDGANKRALKKLGWKVIIVWECQTKHAAKLRSRLRRLTGSESGSRPVKRCVI
jgi:DNA mismatch endonuclease, patch repair protein